jgi:PBP1b-binding outer membrane lipoprotein LpoB
MSKKLLLFCTTLCILLLAGCSTTVPVKQKFPDAPKVLMEKCEPLETIEQPSIVFSEFLKTVTKNYTKHHSCAKLVEAWQEWYTEQKKISDELNK